MKYADLRRDMRVRALGDYADCFRKDDIFVIQHDESGYFIQCRDHLNGPHHGLEPMEDEHGNLPEFEEVVP